MTVSEMIKLLAAMPQDAEVVVTNRDDDPDWASDPQLRWTNKDATIWLEGPKIGAKEVVLIP